MKLKKLPILLSAFFALFVLNGFLLYSLNHGTKLHEAQARILADLESLDVQDGKQFGQSAPFVMGAIESDVKLVDGRSALLRRYLRSIDSPLFDHADLIVAEADKYGFDYRVVVAIAMQESTGCKVIPPDSHNCWGWGIYGGKVTRFESYEDAIRTVSKGIKENYIDKGLVSTEDIMKKYTPSSDGSWAWGIRFFFDKIENY